MFIQYMTIAVLDLGDLGRYPLHIRLSAKAVNVWGKLLAKLSGSFPYIAYIRCHSVSNNFDFPVP